MTSERRSRRGDDAPEPSEGEGESGGSTSSPSAAAPSDPTAPSPHPSYKYVEPVTESAPVDKPPDDKQRAGGYVINPKTGDWEIENPE